MKLETSKPTAAQLLKPSDTLGVYLVDMSKAMALALLEANAKNRTLAQTSVTAYTREMRGLRWELNGDSIRFDRDGKLIDGQHRLAAVVEAAGEDADFSVPMIVFTGLVAHSTRTMDDGRKRSAADEINFGLPADAKDGTRIVGALRVLDIFARQEAGGRLTKSTLLALWDRNPLIAESVKYVFADADGAKAIPLRVSIIVALHYAAHHLMPSNEAAADAADKMVDVMRTGYTTPSYAAGEREDPMHQLRELATSAGKSYSPWRELQMIRAMTKVWGLYVDGLPKLNGKETAGITAAFYALAGLDLGLLYSDMPEREVAEAKLAHDAEPVVDPKAVDKAAKAAIKATAKVKDGKKQAPAATVAKAPAKAAGKASKGKETAPADLTVHKDDDKTPSTKLPLKADGTLDTDAVAAALPDDITERLLGKPVAGPSEEDKARAAEARKGTVRVHA